MIPADRNTSACGMDLDNSWGVSVGCCKIYLLVTEGWAGWANNPYLTHLSLVYSLGPSVVLCDTVLYQ